MNWVTGTIIYAGALLGAVIAYFRAGGGMEGYYAARAYLEGRFPTAGASTIDAVMSRVSETAAAGRQYQNIPGGTAPATGSVPDMRPPERRSGAVTPDANGNYPPTTVFTQVDVEIYDPANPAGSWFRVPINLPSDRPLTADEIEERALAETEREITDFIDSPTVQTRDRELETRISIAGAYRGY